MNMMTIDTTEARTLFEILVENMQKFEAQIAKLSARSVKLGMAPSPRSRSRTRTSNSAAGCAASIRSC
jgi:hypothetical protein